MNNAGYMIESGIGSNGFKDWWKT